LEDTLAAKFTKSYGDHWHEFYYRETPQHPQSIQPFALGRTPVTNALYAQFIAAEGYRDPRYWTPEGWAWRISTNRTQPHLWGDPKFAGDQRPVIGVTWFEAIAFTRWASAVTGVLIRLPNEIEWEWAARGENTKWLYPWGGVWSPDNLNSGVDGIDPAPGTTIDVGQYSPRGDGPFGHADLLGQTWEWMSSAFAPYPYANDGREDVYGPERRVLRGGSWGDGKYANRVTTRVHFPGNYGDMTTGFRVAANLDQLPLAERPKYDLVIYGKTVFCPDLVNGKRWLRAWGTPYRQLNIDLDEAAAYKLDSWLGMRVVPTYIIAEHGQIDPITPPLDADFRNLRNADRGSMLHEADEAGLRTFLARHGLWQER
jgi:formylglycine-generating enzyme required for sulfatase activity